MKPKWKTILNSGEITKARGRFYFKPFTTKDGNKCRLDGVVSKIILSTLQEYAKEVEKVIGEDEDNPTDCREIGNINRVKGEQRQALNKLNTTYGLKGEK